jgi:hypothetical protein
MSKSPRKPPAPSAGYLQMRDIQRSFATAIMRPLTKDNGMQPTWLDGQSSEKAVAAFIKPNDRLTSFDRLEIYNKQYWFRLLDSLYEDFPGLRTLIGDERFHEMSIAYLTKYPSNSYTMRDLGDRMEKFLTRERKWIQPYEELALELVRLEWAHIVAFDGEALPPLEIDALLDGGDPAKLQLHFQPYLTFLSCDYAVDDFIISVRRRQEPQGEASNAVTERVARKTGKKLKLPVAKKICLAVHRSDQFVWYKRIEPEAYAIAAALQKGLPLQAACERAFRRKKMDPNFGTTLQGWFAQWAAFGWFCRAQ